MVNPYLMNTGPRAPPKPQIQLSQSQAMKKFEKIQAKNSASIDRRSNSFTRKSSRSSFDSSKEGDEKDEDDEDSIFKNSKKFMKKTPKTSVESNYPPVKTRQFIKNQQNDEDEIEEDDDEDIEISAYDVNRNNSRMSYKNNANKNRSGASSVSSIIGTNDLQSSHRRSQSKVKFVPDNINDYLSDNQESTIIEDLMSRNLVLDVEDLEPAMSNSNKSPRKSSIRKISKSPQNMMNQKRSESAASIRSIIEEKENSSYSSLTPSIPSPSLLETNLILDINELEKNVVKKDSNKKKLHKNSETISDTDTTVKATSRLDSSSETSSSESMSRKKDKKKTNKDKEKQKKKEKRKKEKIKKEKKEKKEKEKKEKKEKEKKERKEKERKEKKKEKKEKEKKKEKSKKSKSYSTVKTEKYSEDETAIETDIETENQIESTDEDEIKTYKNETDTSRPSSRTTTTATTVRSKTNTRRPTSRSSITRENKSSYYDDFETDQDLTVSRPDSSRKKQLSFAAEIRQSTKTKSGSVLKDAEIQVNTNDLFKNSDFVRSLNIYNPSSLLLSSLAQFDQVNLRDLNQITGYNMINHAFNDLFKANLNFIRNFLSTQRNMYEIQMQSIEPKK